MRRPRLTAAAAAAADLLGRLLVRLPGLGAIACAVAGTWMLFGLGWALLAAVPFLLLLDRSTPGPAR